MERLIDATRLNAVLQNIKTHLEEKGRAAAVWIEYVMEVVNNQPTIVQPLNPPLTLGELREMDGEPVWVVHPENLFEPCWMLVMVRNDFVMANWQVCDFNTYGKTWLAYRRKSVEETTDVPI